MKRLILSAAALTLAAAPAVAEELKLETGQWENTINMSMEMNMGGQTMSMPMGPQVNSRCVTEEDATFNPDNITEEGCSVNYYTEEGRTISFNIQCSRDGMDLDGDMEVTLGADGKSTTGTMVLTGVSQQVGEVKINADISGKHTGACT